MNVKGPICRALRYRKSGASVVLFALACLTLAGAPAIERAAALGADPENPAVEPVPLAIPFTAEAAVAAQTAWAKSLGREVVEKNSIAMELVLIPPGKFRMGSPRSEGGREDDEDQVDVTLTKPFCLGKTEVTQGQWRTVMGTTPWTGTEYGRDCETCAATYINWEDARAFCRKLGEIEHVAYRLPTEAEWEFACRAGTTTRYSFGDAEKSVGDYAWFGGLEFEGNARKDRYSHEVGTRKPNPFGLFDMHGNAWEWCEDAYAVKLPGGTDPVLSARTSVRVFRGGSWTRSVSQSRSANREWYVPAPRALDVGFRVVRSLPAL